MRQERVVSGRMLKCVVALTIIFLATGALWPHRVLAIPAFARKYQTSCQTCHVAFPALTPFGEAYRMNGYRFPAGTDPGMSKDQPVSLGAEGYKKLWPKAVWPGELPGVPPLAVIMTSTLSYDHNSKAFSFGGMGGEFEILGAGTLGESFSFWGSVIFERDGAAVATAMERLNLQIHPLAGPELQFKVGSFEPGLLLLSTHRSLMDSELLALTGTAGDNAWSPEPFQQGFEAFGVVQHRFFYNAGLLDGSGSPGDKSKDVYGRAAWKFGGLEADCNPKGGMGEEHLANPKPWSEKSATLSAFAYKGKGLLGSTEPEALSPRGIFGTPRPAATAADGTEPGEDGFRVFGGDVALNYLDLMFHAGAIDRKDDAPFLDDPTAIDVKISSQFADVLWVAYPWLIPEARWESFKVGEEKTDRISVTVTGLARANVKSFIATDWLRESGGKFENEEVLAGVQFGF